VINDKGDVLKDQLLHIKSIEIDEIDIGSLVYEGVYTPNIQNHGPHNRDKQEMSSRNHSRMSHRWDTTAHGDSSSHHRSTCGF
jgi:hypothetical protein